jgi:hypothetical protein
MYRDRKYIEVDVELSNKEINITPKKSSVIEDNNIKAKAISIDDVIKKLSKENSLSSNSESRRRYDR